jgi:colicin import membrane protein
MTEQRLKVESGPPEHVIADSDVGQGAPEPQDQGAKDKAQEAAATAKDKVQEAAAPAKEKAREVAGQAKAQAQEQAQQAAAQAKDKASAQVDEKTTQAGQQIATQAQSLDGVAEELRRQGKEGPAKVAEQAGEKVKDVASYLEQADGEKLVQAATDVARENPAAAAAASAAAGFVAGRVIKASQSDSPEEAQPESPSEGGQ